MKLRNSLLFLLVLGVGACGGDAAESEDMAAEAAPEMSADETAIAEMAEYWATHYNMGHPEMVASVYAEDAWFLGADGGLANGREAIAGMLGESADMSPQITITPGETMIFGEQAVGYGSYEINMTPEGGEAVTWGGTYMTHSRKIEGEWKIAGHIGNLTNDPFEGFPWTAPEGEPEADEQTDFDELTQNWALHYNMGHASMVADYHTEDGMASFSRGGPQMGRAAIAEQLQVQMDTNGLQLEITELGNQELADGWQLVGGSWTGTAADAESPSVAGGWFNLVRQQDDGSWLIHWTVGNSWPIGM